MSYTIFTVICTVIAYPFCGAILYGNPWKWIFEEESNEKQI